MNQFVIRVLRLISVVFVAMYFPSGLANAAELPSCSEVFTDGIQANSNSGVITFESGAKLIGSPDNVIDTKWLTDKTSGDSCGATSCVASGGPTELIQYNDFKNNRNNINVSSGSSQALASGDYDDIVLRAGATLYLTGDVYRIWGTLYLSEGSRVVISASMAVRILVRNRITVRDNAAINAEGQAADVILYGHRDIGIDAGASVTGFVYAKENLYVGNNARVNGAISARYITLREDAVVSFVPAEQSRAVFEDLCGKSEVGSGVIDHYGITGPSSALTCEAAVVTISAYDVAGNLVAPTADQVISLSASPGVDGWSLYNGAGTFIGPNRYQYSGTESRISFHVTRTSPATDLDIDVSDGSASDPDDGGLKDQRIDFVDVGFKFSADGASDSIGTQIAGKSSGAAPGAQAVELRALQTNTETGACEARLLDTQTVSLAYECQNPGTCQAGDRVTVNGTSIPGNPYGSVSSYRDVTLNFGTDGRASLPFSYSDAGQIVLHASKSIAAVGAEPAVTLMGSSNSFVVRPFGFYLDIPGNPAATDGSGGAFKRAGEVFTTTLKAVIWSSSDDDGVPSGTANDGIPDRNDDLADNAVTPNFGQESMAERASIIHGIVAPSTGNNPALSGSAFSGFSAGARTNADMAWPEVGIISFNAGLSDSDYLGSGADVVGSVGHVGRFYPDHFLVEGALSSIDAACTGSNAYTYMGDVLQLNFQIQAKNSDGDTTVNYDGDFVKLDEASGSLLPGATQSGIDLSSRLTGVTGSVLSGSSFIWVAGAGGVNTPVIFQRVATEDGPYRSLDIGIKFLDSDGVSLSQSELDLDVGSGDEFFRLGTTDVRFGRMQIQNTYGPETATVNQPVFFQYFNGTHFVTNTDDTCTPFAASNITLQVEGETALAPGVVTDVEIGSGTTNLAIGTPLTEGHVNLTYSAPGAGNTGTISNTYSVPAWLQFDWDGDGIHDNNPSATAIFGRYRGNDRVIYWLEQ